MFPFLSFLAAATRASLPPQRKESMTAYESDDTWSSLEEDGDMSNRNVVHDTFEMEESVEFIMGKKWKCGTPTIIALGKNKSGKWGTSSIFAEGFSYPSTMNRDDVIDFISIDLKPGFHFSAHDEEVDTAIARITGKHTSTQGCLLYGNPNATLDARTLSVKNYMTFRALTL